MSTLREEEFENFLRRRISSMNGILIHGADQAAVSMMARRVVTALKSEAQQVDLAAAKAAPGGFLDQMLSLSMFGDRQILLVDGVDETSLKFFEPAFAQTRLTNFVLATADNLGKLSKLRAAAETASLFACLAVYEEDEAAARERVRKLLSAHNLFWGEGAEEAFFDTVGHDRTIVTCEVEKLSVYAMGQSEVSAGDVSAICGDVANFEVDELVDAVLGGDLEATDRIFTALGTEQQRFFPLFAIHLNRLQGFCVEMENGGSLDSVLRNARPPIFFKRKNAYAAQLRAFTLEDVLGVQESVQDTVLQSRKLGDLSGAITSRSLLAMARMCRLKRAG